MVDSMAEFVALLQEPGSILLNKALIAVCLEMGPEKMCSEMLPFLTNIGSNKVACSLQEGEAGDEILTVVAETVKNNPDVFITAVGGKASAHKLLAPLLELVKVDETLVREEAVKAIVAVSAQLSPDQIFKNLAPSVSSLFDDEWFVPKMSGCGLFCTAFKGCVLASGKSTLSLSAYESQRDQLTPKDDSKPESLAITLFTKFRGSLNDSESMVRRCAAGKLTEVVIAIGHELTADLVENYATSVLKDHDSIRVNWMRATPAMLANCQGTNHFRTISEAFYVCADDKSWRVRNQVAESLPAVAKAVESPEDKALAMKHFTKLLDGSEEQQMDVRMNTAKFAGVAATVFGTQYTKDTLVPCLYQFLTEEEQSTGQNKMELLQQLFECAHPLGSVALEVFIQPHSEYAGKSLVEYLLTHTDSNTSQRILIIQYIGLLVQMLGKDAEPMLELIQHMCIDPNWRTRRHAMMELVNIAQCITPEEFDKYFIQEAEGGLPLLGRANDSCALIRLDFVEVCRQIANLPRYGGARWLVDSGLIKVLKNIANESKNYQVRTVVLDAAVAWAPLLLMKQSKGHQASLEELFPMLLKATEDRVPNLRLQAATSLGKIVKLLPEDMSEQKVSALEVLKKLENDTDPDVKTCAADALAMI